MKKFFFALIVCASSTALFAQPNTNYVYDATDLMGDMGDMVSTSVTLDSTMGMDVSGWSLGVCSDPAVVQVDSAEDGAATNATNGGGGADFSQVNVLSDGFNQGVVISFTGMDMLSPAAGQELAVANYTLIGANGTTSTLDFCDTLGMPPVTNVVVVGGLSITPVQNGADVTIGMVMGGDATYTAADATFDLSSGSPITVDVSIADAAMVEGFSIGLGNDSSLLNPTAFDQAGVVAGLNGGAGADFFGTNILPEGVTVGCVFSFSSPVTLDFPAAPGDVAATVTYELAGGAAPADGDTTSLDFIDTLGTPPVDNVVVIGGFSEDAMGVSGTVTFMGMGMGNLAEFIRGECNQDDRFDIADPIFTLDFINGGTAPDCPGSCDSDDDDDVDLDDAMFSLMYLFLGGPAPSAPFPGCGTDPDVDTTECTFAACP